MSDSVRKECLFQFGMAQPFFPPSQAGNFNFGATLEQLDSDATHVICHVPNLIIHYYNVFWRQFNLGSIFLRLNLVRLEFSLRSRRLEVVGARTKGRAKGRHARGEEAPARKAHELGLAHETFGVWTGPNARLVTSGICDAFEPMWNSHNVGYNYLLRFFPWKLTSAEQQGFQVSQTQDFLSRRSDHFQKPVYIDNKNKNKQTAV